ncbi:hypothetical protein JHK87_052812 [Glycine soja]|nr:hypothetical protein JHK87_052812 [Glycine soja]
MSTKSLKDKDHLLAIYSTHMSDTRSSHARTTRATMQGKGYYDYQNPPWVNKNMIKTQWRRHQRLRRDAILAMQQKSGVRPLMYNRISPGPPPGFKTKMSIKDQEEKEMIIESLEFGFDDSLEDICGFTSLELGRKYYRGWVKKHHVPKAHRVADWPIFEYGVGPFQKVAYLQALFCAILIGSSESNAQ